MEGSGVIKKSSFGYKIGDRIKTTCTGASGGYDFPKKFGSYRPNRGDEGIITGVCGDYTEILYDCGQFGYRNDGYRESNFDIIPNPTIAYEIY